MLLVMQGWASTMLPPLDGPPPSTGMQPLLDVLLQHVPPPHASPEEAFAMCVAMIERDPFVGRIATGTLDYGVARTGLAHTQCGTGLCWPPGSLWFKVELVCLLFELHFQGLSRCALDCFCDCCNVVCLCDRCTVTRLDWN